MATRPRDREALVVNLVRALTENPRATMAELASMVGVSRATLFRYFPSRQSMIGAITQACADSTEAALGRARPREGHFEDALLRMIEEMLPVAEMCTYTSPCSHGGMLANEPAERAGEAHSMSLRTSLIALFRQWQHQGVLKPDLPAAWMVESLILLLRGAATLVRNGHVARHDAARNVFSLFCNGITK